MINKSCNSIFFIAFTLTCFAGYLTTPIQAQTVASSNSGWFTSENTGNTAPTWKNYFAGYQGSEFRDWFIFDLSGITTPVGAATLNLFNPAAGFGSNKSSETYQLTDTTTSVNDLQGTSNTASIFPTLGTGTVFSTDVVTAADDNHTISLSLNADGLYYINSHLGRIVAFSGLVSSLSGNADQYVFAGTDLGGGHYGANAATPAPTLTLSDVSTSETPEPGALTTICALSILGMSLILRCRGRRNSHRVHRFLALSRTLVPLCVLGNEIPAQADIILQ